MLRRHKVPQILFFFLAQRPPAEDAPSGTSLHRFNRQYGVAFQSNLFIFQLTRALTFENVLPHGAYILKRPLNGNFI